MENAYTSPQQPAPIKPGNNLVWAILTTLLCCLPFGIVAIVYASKVDALWYAGYYDEARTNAKKAGNWSIASAVCGLIFIIAYAVFMVVFAEELISHQDNAIYPNSLYY